MLAERYDDYAVLGDEDTTQAGSSVVAYTRPYEFWSSPKVGPAAASVEKKSIGQAWTPNVIWPPSLFD